MTRLLLYITAAVLLLAGAGACLVHEHHQTQRLNLIRDSVDAQRHGRPALFWFSDTDPLARDFNALISRYPAQYHRISDCRSALTNTLIVTVGSLPDLLPTQGELAACWAVRGVYPRLDEVDFVAGSRPPRAIVMIQAEQR
jgi:hypothetical protein